MARQEIQYEVIGTATTTSISGRRQRAVKLLYRADGTPWWTCSAGLELRVNEEFFAAVTPGDTITLTLSTSEGTD